MSNFLSPQEGNSVSYPDNLFLDTTLEALEEAADIVDKQTKADGSTLLVITFSNPFAVLHAQMSPEGRIYANGQIALEVLKERLLRL